MTCKPQFLFCLKYWSGNPFTDSFEIIRGSSKNEFVHSCFKKEQARYTYEWVSTYHSWFYFGLMLIITWRPRKARWSYLDIVIWCFGQMGQYQVLSPSPTYLPFSSPFKKSFNYFVGKERPTSNNHHCYPSLLPPSTAGQHPSLSGNEAPNEKAFGGGSLSKVNICNNRSYHGDSLEVERRAYKKISNK